MKRIASLDSLRGLAAMAVVFSHIHGIFFSHHIFLDLTPLRIFWSGNEAVILFYVLSGFVLSAPFCKGESVQFDKFIATRLSRIYIPYIVIIIVSVILSVVLTDPTILTKIPFLSKRWPRPIEWQMLLSHIWLVGNFCTSSYNEVIWSLVHEMRFALIFPIFICIINHLSWKKCLTGALFISAISALAFTIGVSPSQGFKNSYLHSSHYLLFFMMGGLLAKNHALIGILLEKISPYKKLCMLLGGLSLYIYSFVLIAFPLKMNWEEIALFNEFIADWGAGIAASIFIILAVHNNRTSKFLNAHLFLFLFLGKISFSLYLVHIPILAVSLYFFNGISTSIAVLIAFPIIFIVALVFHNWVEIPAQKLGRKFFQKKPSVEIFSGS